MSGIPTIIVMVLGNLGTEPKLQSYGCLKIDSSIPGNRIWMNKDEASALMVLNDKTSGFSLAPKLCFQTP